MSEELATRLQQVYRDVLPWANAGRGLPPDLEGDPNYAAAYALWRVVLAEKSPASARLGAIKEYHDRVYGKVASHDETKEEDNKVKLDLDCLSPDERDTFLVLLARVQGMEPNALLGNGGGEEEEEDA